MNYEAKINDIESKITVLEEREINSTLEEKILLRQSIIELLKTRNSYLELLYKKHNARPGIC